MARLLRKHRAILYRLKHEWGQDVYLYRPKQASHNVTTGVISREFDVHLVKKAPVLPLREDRSFVYDLAYIAVGKNFTEGAFFDRTQGEIILEGKQLNITPNRNDFIVFGYRRYEIRSIEYIQKMAAYRLRVQAIANQDSQIWVAVTQGLSFSQAVSYEF